ncbi:MAG: sugar ABC transporter permease [Fimbriimonadaceae bacterium]|nr:sugar ABC transporter permease [Fimbriimonadaceae bacterium]
MIRRQSNGWFFVAPALLHLIVFALIPVGYAFWISLHDWDILKGTIPFVGLGRYEALAGNAEFWNSLRQTGMFALMSVPLGMAVALAVAIAVAKPLKGMAIFRTIFYIPAVGSGVAISMLWITMYLPESGFFNVALAWLSGGRFQSIDWLNHPSWALAALAFMSIWVGLGPRMIIYVAGLLNLPTALYEAASLDGATPFRQFWRITMPLLAPTHLFVLVTASIGAFQTFTPVYMMTQGRPEGTTDLVGFHIFEEAWRKFNVSNAAAQSFVLLLVLALLSLAQFRLMKRQLEDYDAGH